MCNRFVSILWLPLLFFANPAAADGTAPTPAEVVCFGDSITRHPEVAARLRAEYDKWWNEIQPFLVNEDAIGPKINPMKALYWEQFGGAPDKDMMRRMSPTRLIGGKKKPSKK